VVVQGCYSGVTVVLQWCYSGITAVLKWCYSVVTVLSQCCRSVVTVVLQWCYSGVTHLVGLAVHAQDEVLVALVSHAVCVCDEEAGDGLQRDNLEIMSAWC
jgi:hypothetical protein